MVSIVVYMRATELVTMGTRDRANARGRQENYGTENLTTRQEGREENKKNGTPKANGEVRMCGQVEGEEGSRINLFARKLGVAASLVKNGEDAGGVCGDETSK
jgi:hypothetical protein